MADIFAFSLREAIVDIAAIPTATSFAARAV
jgi:hypothetical protein